MPSARDIAFVGCRLLALFVLYGVVLNAAHYIPFILQSMGVPGWEYGRFDLQNSVWLATSLVVLFVLWFGAGWLAEKVAGETREAKELAPASWSPHDVLSLAITTIGLWILIHDLPVLLSYAPLIIPDPSDKIWPDLVVPTPNIISALCTSVLGLLFVLSSRGIAKFIAGLRRW